MKFVLSSTKAIKMFLATGLLSLIALPVFAADDDPTPFENRSDAVDEVVEQPDRQQQAESKGPVEDVKESAQVLQKMQSDAELQQLLGAAKGVFIIPDYVTAALIVGGAGGEGILLTRDNGEWSNPAFYDIGELDVGAQAGVAAGAIAMVLTGDNAINSFKQDTNFSLTADAGYSVINWSERARGQIGLDSDVVVWTDTEGLLGELAVGVTGISYDEEESEEYYGERASAEEIINGEVQDPQQLIQQALKE